MATQEFVDQNGPEHKIKWAEKLIAKGFKVFPLQFTGTRQERKRPLLKGWQKDATNDPQEIRRIWGRYPQAGIGILADGKLILDFDTKNGPAEGVREVLEAKLKEKLPPTLVFQTSSYGEHWIYDLPPGVELKNSQGAKGGLAPDVDTRTNGGYIVAPGTTIDPDGSYRMVMDKPIAQAPRAIVAQLLRNAMRTVAGTDIETEDTPEAIRAATHAAQGLSSVHQGGRNGAAYEAAQYMREFGVSQASAVEILSEHWNLAEDDKGEPKVDPPLEQFELARTVRSAYEKEKQENPFGFRLDGLNAAMDYGQAYAVAPPQEADPEAITTLPIKAWDNPALTSIEPRRWIVENVCAAGYVTAVIGQAGVSKSTWALHLALAIAADRPEIIQTPFGDVPRLKQATVLVHNSEDDTTEMQRRIVAEVIANKLDPKAIQARVFTSSSADDEAEPLLLANAKGDLAEPNEKAIKRLIETIKKIGARVVILDPIAELHNVTENSNDSMKVVGGILRRIAKATDAAVVFVAHSRKPENTRAQDGEAGNLHMMRGAGAMGGVIRLAFTVTNMTDNDLRDYGVKPEARDQFVRLTMAKNNLGRTNAAPCWYKRVGVSMGPLSEQFEVGALVPHKFTRVEDAGETLWMLMERLILAKPDEYAVNMQIPATTLIKSAPAAEQLSTRKLGDALKDWMDGGAVRNGLKHRVHLAREGAGTRTRWLVWISNEAPEVEDYLA